MEVKSLCSKAKCFRLIPMNRPQSIRFKFTSQVRSIDRILAAPVWDTSLTTYIIQIEHLWYHRVCIVVCCPCFCSQLGPFSNLIRTAEWADDAKRRYVIQYTFGAIDTLSIWIYFVYVPYRHFNHVTSERYDFISYKATTQNRVHRNCGDPILWRHNDKLAAQLSQQSYSSSKRDTKQ